jgi:hypoxanthine phosphoribosyltransferase
LEFVGIPTDHIAIRTSSYYGIDKQSKDIRVHGLDCIVKNVNADQELLIVDDVFDSGRSIKAIIDEIKRKSRRNTPNVIKVACPWYKPERNVTDFVPDFYIHATDQWLVFPHELCGLSSAEILEVKGSEVAGVIARARQ